MTSYQPTDRELLGDHWSREKIDALTESERALLTDYWRRTRNFTDKAEPLIELFISNPSPPKSDVEAANALLSEWAEYWTDLRFWQDTANNSRADDPSNPVNKKLEFDEQYIFKFRINTIGR
jgi:hypothetical protein